MSIGRCTFCARTSTGAITGLRWLQALAGSQRYSPPATRRCTAAREPGQVALYGQVDNVLAA